MTHRGGRGGPRRRIEAALGLTAIAAALMVHGPTGADNTPPKGTEKPRAWTFEELLAPPSSAEVDAVDREWATVSRAADSVTRTSTTRVVIGGHWFDVRFITHRVTGPLHCGAVLVPSGATQRSLPAIVDVPSVRWDYNTRNISEGPYLMTRILESEARRFVFIVPCLRGNALEMNGTYLRAEGDRRDAWQGAAQDAMTFLTAALVDTSEIDPDRITVYGYSRGGGVALLVGERDPRIRAVLAFAAPTDWFKSMKRGTTWPQDLQAASVDPDLRPSTLASQFLDWFVRDRNHLPLSGLRQRILASSPLYFAGRLPVTQVHQGEDDPAVPVQNATALRDALQTSGKVRSEVYLYPGKGHLLDGTAAMATARAFLLKEMHGIQPPVPSR